MSNSVPYERQGRSRQKTRTRSALVVAARQLLAEGITPTVEQAADRADVSRTTAYRYFPNQRSLIVATYPEIELQSQLGVAPSPDPETRLDAVIHAFTRQVLEHEPELRAQLRLSLGPQIPGPAALPFRQGRAIAWIEEALTPLSGTFPSIDVHRLAIAIRSACGIEALVWLRDVAHLSGEEAVDVMRSTARTLLRGTIADAGSR